MGMMRACGSGRMMSRWKGSDERVGYGATDITGSREATKDRHPSHPIHLSIFTPKPLHPRWLTGLTVHRSHRHAQIWNAPKSRANKETEGEQDEQPQIQSRRQKGAEILWSLFQPISLITWVVSAGPKLRAGGQIRLQICTHYIHSQTLA